MQFGRNNTPFTEQEFADRVRRTKAGMAKADLDVLIVSGPANINYLTGYDGYSFYVHQAVVVAQDLDRPIWIGRKQDVNGARLTTTLPEEAILGYPEDYVQTTARHPMQFVADVLRSKGLDRKRIGVEGDSYYFTGRALDTLRAALPDARIADAGLLVNWVRVVKSAAEIAYMREAARISEITMRRALDMIDVGVRQCDVAAEILNTQIRATSAYGGDYPAIMPLMPTGMGTSCPHVTWRDEPFAPDAGTTVEIAGVRHHYHVPLTRTIYLGTPPERMLSAARIVQEGIEAALDAIRPGALGRDVHAAWTAVIERHGIFKDSRCGYSIGLGYPPDWGEHTVSFRKEDETVLAPDMTIHFMPGIWKDDWGIAISETIRVTEDGVETLCRFPRDLVVK